MHATPPAAILPLNPHAAPRPEGTPFPSLARHEGEVRGVLALGDGRVLSWSMDSTLRLWDAGGTPLATLTGHQAGAGVAGALELRDGRLLSWSGYTPRLWDAGGAHLATLVGHEGTVLGVRELGDGRLLSWSGNNKPRLWNAGGSPPGHAGRARGVGVRGPGAAGWASALLVGGWHAAAVGRGACPLATLVGHRDHVWGALELRDGRLLSWSWDGTLRLWDAAGTALATLVGHDEGVARGQRSQGVEDAMELRDGRLLSWSWDRTLRLWGAEGGSIATFYADTGILCCTPLALPDVVVGDEDGRVIFLRLPV